MSLAGFKKQFNKTSQFLSEKVGGNKGSELEDEIVNLGAKMDVVNDCIENMQNKTKEYLQPNPSARTKLAVQSSMHKVRGQSAAVKYPQPEFNLGEVFKKAGAGLDENTSIYGAALSELGSGFIDLSDLKDSMEETITSSYLCPLHEIQQQDLKEIANHRKKLESRRLDYDYKKSKGAKVPSDELQAAQDKFEDSKEICFNSMSNFFDQDVEHITQLHAFASAITQYHQKCADVMENVTSTLSNKVQEANSLGRGDRRSFSRGSLHSTGGSNPSIHSNGGHGNSFVSPPPAIPEKKVPSCRALFDFDAENEGELEFKKDDIIEISSRIDENWLQGSCKGREGYFPENFVEIVVPIN